MPFILSRTQAKISSGFKTVSVYTNFFSPHHKNKPPPARENHACAHHERSRPAAASCTCRKFQLSGVMWRPIISSALRRPTPCDASARICSNSDMSLISHKMHAGTNKKANPIDRSLSNLRILHSIISVLDSKPTTLTNTHLPPLKIKIYPRKKSSTPSIGRITVPELKHWPQILPLALRKPLRCPRKPILSPPKFHLFCPAVNHVKPLAFKYERQNSASHPLDFHRSIVPLSQNFFAHDSSRFLSH